MRRGNEILKQRIGHQLKDGLIQLYYYNGILTDQVNLVYLKFDKWLRICTSDETVILEVDSTEPEQIKSYTDNENSTIEYPLVKLEKEFPEFKKYYGQKLIDFKELTMTKFEDNITTGLKFNFEGGLTFTLWTNIEDETFLIFDDQLPTELKEKRRNAH